MHTDSIEAVLGQMIPVLLSTDEPPVIHLLEGASRKVKQLTDVLSFLSQHGSKPCVDMLLKNSEFIVLQCQRSDLRSGSYTIAHTAAFLLQALQKSMTKYPRFFEVFLEVRDQQLLLKWMPVLQMSSGEINFAQEPNCLGNLICDRGIARLYNQLCSDFSILLLQSACTTAYKLSTKQFAFLQARAVYDSKADGKLCQYPADADSTHLPPSTTLPRARGDWRRQMLGIMTNHQNQSAQAVSSM